MGAAQRLLPIPKSHRLLSPGPWAETERGVATSQRSGPPVTGRDQRGHGRGPRGYERPPERSIPVAAVRVGPCFDFARAESPVEALLTVANCGSPASVMRET
jgi:hypothetical protein